MKDLMSRIVSELAAWSAPINRTLRWGPVMGNGANRTARKVQ